MDAGIHFYKFMGKAIIHTKSLVAVELLFIR